MSEKWAEMQGVCVDVQVCKTSIQTLTWALLSLIKMLYNWGLLLDSPFWEDLFYCHSLSFLFWRRLISILNGLVLSGTERRCACHGTVTILTNHLLQVE